MIAEHVLRRGSLRTRSVYSLLKIASQCPTYLRRVQLRRALPPSPLRIDPNVGFAFCEPGGLLPLIEVAEEARRQYQMLGADRTLIRHKERYLAKVPLDGTLSISSPLVSFALHPMLVGAAAEYLGILPIVSAIWIWYSPNEVRTTESYNSQDAHLDHEDTRQLKLFVYATDVDEESGPLHVLSADQSRRVIRRNGYRLGQTLDDHKLAEALGPRRPLPILGPPGTAVMVDTSRCLHFGSRPGRKPRLLFGVQYLSPCALKFSRTWPRGELACLVEHGMEPVTACLLGHREPFLGLRNLVVAAGLNLRG